jgi:calcineurin-like phosphoesterase
MKKFLTLLPTRFAVAEKDIRINGVVVSVDRESGKGVRIERINKSVPDFES